MTYYLRENAYPADKVELRLVVNAGSMQEDEDQLGMAHFLEHMAFNGTENFEKNDLVDFLQSIGVQFGADLNAYTSFDETVYILPLPSDNDSLFSVGMTVLRDWASNMLLEEEEIDKERGVVLEEWRLGQGAQQRMRDQYFPILFKNSRYAERLPIGTKASIETTPQENIKRFYDTWYRPDLMAIVAVGDTDMEALEKKIIDQFSDLEARAPARTKESNAVPGHEETLVAITKDVENSFTAAQLIYKQPIRPEKNLGQLRKNYLYALYNAMLNSRLQELTQQADPPFIFGASSFGSLVRSTYTYSSFAVAAPDEITGALATLVQENERVKLFGFNETELERAIKNMKIQLESIAKEQGKTESGNYASEYVSHFLSQIPSPGIDFELSFLNDIAPGIMVEEINELAKNWITDESRVAIITGIDKEDVTLPSEEQILEAINNVDTDALEPYDDKVSDSPLIGDLPATGKTLFTKRIDTVGVTELKLSNGLKVVIKPTDFKNDQILMTAHSPGGHGLYPDEDFQSAKMAAGLVNQSGIGEFSLIELRKLLTGKKVEVSPFVTSIQEGFNGSSTPEDFETLLQLVHLYFTSPREDSAVFQSIQSRNKALFENLLVNPQFYFSDQVTRVMTQEHPRGGGLPTPEQMDEVSMSRALSIYRERFNNAGDFTFFFVGNVDIKTAKPLIEKYLGSLPGTRNKEEFVDLGIRPPSGKVDKKFYKGADEKSSVVINYIGFEDISKEENYVLGAFADVLENRLIDILREEESGVYTVSVGKSRKRFPYNQYSLSIRFPCSPENVEKLTRLAYEEIIDIQTNGVEEAEVTKVREADLQNRKENLEKNQFWLSQIRSYYFHKSDLKNFYQHEGFVANLNAKDIQEVATKYIDADNSISMVLYPEKYQD